VTNAEMLLRLLLAALCWATGTSVVVERRDPVGAALLLVAGTTAIPVGVVWPSMPEGGKQ
jgi:hypothetical protein